MPLKEKEKVEESELVHMKIESVEFEKIHLVVEKVDTQEEEEAKNKMIQDTDLIEDTHRPFDEIPQPSQMKLSISESIIVKMALEEKEEGLGLSTEIEAMNFKSPSLISKNVEISVNHQMIDEIPKPNQKVLDTLKGVDEQIEDSFNHLSITTLTTMMQLP